MAHIPEPKNVDFVIESPPLSDKERKELSEFISKIKAENLLSKERGKSSKENKA